MEYCWCMAVRQSEKRKVGGSTPPLTTTHSPVQSFVTCRDVAGLFACAGMPSDLGSSLMTVVRRWIVHAGRMREQSSGPGLGLRLDLWGAVASAPMRGLVAMAKIRTSQRFGQWVRSTSTTGSDLIPAGSLHTQWGATPWAGPQPGTRCRRSGNYL
jgi:hypothetical protein